MQTFGIITGWSDRITIACDRRVGSGSEIIWRVRSGHRKRTRGHLCFEVTNRAL